MSIPARYVYFVLLTSTLASQNLAADPDRTDVLEKIGKHIKPLTDPLGDRLPILTWQSRGFPTGLEDGQVERVQQLLMDRGLSPLCNPIGGSSTAEQYVPVLRYRQSRGYPVCVLPQGWLQAEFVPDRRGRLRSAHQAPAEEREEFPCPALLQDPGKLQRGAARTREVLTLLKEQGITVTLLVVDFEAGAYLRNTADREEAVEEQAAMARNCPRCVQAFTKETLSTRDGYARVVDESRALAIRSILCDPARGVFPDVHIGNFYAWPINRLPRPEGRWPAYGYEQSGMNVAMPRVYMNAGWGGAGRDQEKMNWNAFYCCLEGFSPAASVLREGELLIPWVHVWLGGRYLSFVMRGRKLPEPWVMSEMACHMMLRGAETFAVWMDTPDEFPADYPYPEYAAMGQFVYDVKGVQEGFNRMLRHNSFLRRTRASDSHDWPSSEVITRKAPSGETCAVPSRNRQYHRSSCRARSVNALCRAVSQIRRTSTMVGSGATLSADRKLYQKRTGLGPAEPRCGWVGRRDAAIWPERGVRRTLDATLCIASNTPRARWPRRAHPVRGRNATAQSLDGTRWPKGSR